MSKKSSMIAAFILDIVATALALAAARVQPKTIIMPEGASYCSDATHGNVFAVVCVGVAFACVVIVQCIIAAQWVNDPSAGPAAFFATGMLSVLICVFLPTGVLMRKRDKGGMDDSLPVCVIACPKNLYIGAAACFLHFIIYFACMQQQDETAPHALQLPRFNS